MAEPDLIVGDSFKIAQLFSGGSGYTSESVLFITSAVSGNVQSFRVQRDGWISGWRVSTSAATTQFSIAVNIDPAAAVSAVGVYVGQVHQGVSVGPTDALGQFNTEFRYPIKANDIINVKTNTANQVYLWMILCYPDVGST